MIVNSHIGQVACALIANNKEFWIKEKMSKIYLHPLTSHIHSNLQLRCDFFGE
jgi:hypothetical protein